jgi:hypothetical protein
VPYAKDETSLNYRYDADKQSLSVWLYPESNLHFDKQAYVYMDTWDKCVISVKLTRIVVYSPSLGVIADWQGQAAKGKPKARNKNNA